MNKHSDTALAERSRDREDAPRCAASALDLDTDAYLPELEGMDLTEAQKRDLLQTLWSIMGQFVDLGFQVDVCERVFGEDFALLDEDTQGVDSNDPTNTETR